MKYLLALLVWLFGWEMEEPGQELTTPTQHEIQMQTTISGQNQHYKSHAGNSPENVVLHIIAVDDTHFKINN